MSETTNIAWADHTASPWFGCTEVSAGCANCYARELTLQKKWAGWGDKAPRVRSKGFWNDAYKWNRTAAQYPWMCCNCGTFIAASALNNPAANPGSCSECNHGLVPNRPRIFTSLMDWLDPKVPIEWLADFLRVVHDCQNLDWLLLTKRPGWNSRLNTALDAPSRGPWSMGRQTADFICDWLEGKPPPNVWFGVSVENQAMADKRIPLLLDIPAKVRWLSVEPLLEAIRFTANRPFGIWSHVGTPCCTEKEGFHPYNNDRNKSGGISWVVVGGESGRKRRDCGVDAIISVVEQCEAAGVPVFVKQDCALRPGQQGRIPDEIWKRKEFPNVAR